MTKEEKIYILKKARWVLVSQWLFSIFHKNKTDKYRNASHCLCSLLAYVLKCDDYYIMVHFPMYTYENAVLITSTTKEYPFWWHVNDYYNRLKFINYMISEIKNKE